VLNMLQVDEINQLATSIYEMHGFTALPGFKFYRGTTPFELFCWNIAVVTFNKNCSHDANDEDEVDVREKVTVHKSFDCRCVSTSVH
jgi:hypothetical protein